MLDLIDEPQPFKVTPGFVVFISALFLPMLLALAIYLGAWAVSAEVKAAEAAGNDTAVATTSFKTTEVAGWKKSLVGICPVH